MCYKITSLFGIAHGHAAALCDRILFLWMIDNTEKCIDPRGERYLQKVLDGIGQAMGCKNGKDGAERLMEIVKKLELEIPTATKEQIVELSTSVNTVRLRNHPVGLSDETIAILYHKILNGVQL